jgi:hypothetical protein
LALQRRLIGAVVDQDHPASSSAQQAANAAAGSGAAVIGRPITS